MLLKILFTLSVNRHFLDLCDLMGHHVLELTLAWHTELDFLGFFFMGTTHFRTVSTIQLSVLHLGNANIDVSAC